MENWIKDFKNGEFVIHCETEKEANELMEILNKNNIVWFSGNCSNTHSNYSKYKKDTCYIHDQDGLSFGSKGYFEKTYEDILIIKFSQLQDKNNITKGEDNMNKLIDIVNELNNDLCENNPKLYEGLGVCYSFKTNGYVKLITFIDIVIYNSEDQEYDDNDELIEPTVESIKAETRKLIFEIIIGLGNL